MNESGLINKEKIKIFNSSKSIVHITKHNRIWIDGKIIFYDDKFDFCDIEKFNGEHIKVYYFEMFDVVEWKEKENKEDNND